MHRHIPDGSLCRQKSHEPPWWLVSCLCLSLSLLCLIGAFVIFLDPSYKTLPFSFFFFFFSPSLHPNCISPHTYSSSVNKTNSLDLVPIPTLGRSMDQILHLTRHSLVCASVTVIVVGIYLLIPPRTRITLTGPKDGIKLVNGSTVLENVDKWCQSLKAGFKPSWWLPKSVVQLRQKPEFPR